MADKRYHHGYDPLLINQGSIPELQPMTRASFVPGLPGHEEVQAAAHIFRLSSQIDFTAQNALKMVGFVRVEDREVVHTNFHSILRGMILKYGNADSTISTSLDRAIAIWFLSTYAPRLDKNILKEKASTMRVAGFSYEQTRTGTAYTNFSRKLKERKKQCELEARNEIVFGAWLAAAIRPTAYIELGGHGPTMPSIGCTQQKVMNEISPLNASGVGDDMSTFSFNSALAPSARSSASEISESNTQISSISATSAMSYKTAQSYKKVTARLANPNASSIEKATGKPLSRQTSEAAQKTRGTTKDIAAIQTSALKVGSVLWDLAKNKKNPVEKFSTADKCAEEVNKMFGICCGKKNEEVSNLISGFLLEQAVKNGRVGQSPKQKGRKRTIMTDEDFVHMANLVFTCNAIECANGDEVLANGALRSFVGEIVHSHIDRRKMELSDIDDRELFESILKHNAREQTVGVDCARETRRIDWLNYVAQNQHYINWEKELAGLGFARPSVTEEEKKQGNLVFFDTSRILQTDEYSFSLSGVDERAGGRKPRKLKPTCMQHPGQPTTKNGEKCTVLQGINMADEALPPLVIFPATGQKTKGVNPRQLMGFQSIYGQYGFTRKCAVECTIAHNSKGGMNGQLWEDYFLKHLMYLYPDAKDVPGKRVLVKADSGPGRIGSSISAKWLAAAQQAGFYFYPGLPNGTEVGQEMDQLFSCLKSLIYKNRDKLWRMRRSTEPSNANVDLSLQDIGFIMFGGEVFLTDGSTCLLQNAFVDGLTPEHIRAAREKCGYCPATRKGLKSNLVRHEVVEALDGTTDLTADPLGELLDGLEQDNIRAQDALIASGYSEEAVRSLSRRVKRITSEQVLGREATTTKPNTRERQDLLMKISTAGGHFRVTLGGGPLNSSDMLLAFERKRMLIAATVLEKKRAVFEEFRMVKAEYDRTVLETTELKQMTAPQLKAIVKFKSWGVEEDVKLSGLNKARMHELALEYKDKPDPLSPTWTRADDDELVRLQSGEISHYEETTIFRDSIAVNNQILTTKLVSLSKSQRATVLENLFLEVTAEELDSLVELAAKTALERSSANSNLESYLEDSQDDQYFLETLRDSDTDAQSAEQDSRRDHHGWNIERSNSHLDKDLVDMEDSREDNPRTLLEMSDSDGDEHSLDIEGRCEDHPTRFLDMPESDTDEEYDVDRGGLSISFCPGSNPYSQGSLELKMVERERRDDDLDHCVPAQENVVHNDAQLENDDLDPDAPAGESWGSTNVQVAEELEKPDHDYLVLHVEEAPLDSSSSPRFALVEAGSDGESQQPDHQGANSYVQIDEETVCPMIVQLPEEGNTNNLDRVIVPPAEKKDSSCHVHVVPQETGNHMQTLVSEENNTHNQAHVTFLPEENNTNNQAHMHNKETSDTNHGEAATSFAAKITTNVKRPAKTTNKKAALIEDEDGNFWYAPALKPKELDGQFVQPKGRPKKDCVWDPKKGLWKKIR